MKKLRYLFFLIAIPMICYSQENYTNEFGKVTQYEMSITEYDKDKDAEALVIHEIGENYFQGDDSRGFLLHMTRVVKIKILKQAGLKYANFEIPYYNGDRKWEDVIDIQGVTTNFENGKLIKTELNSKNIFEEKEGNNIMIKKIALSDVREGSVIELKYHIVTPYYFHMRKWEFQKKIPVVYSKLRYKAIPYYEYTYIMRGAGKFDETKSQILPSEIRFGNLLYKEVAYDFGMKNLPAFRDEEFITSNSDHMIALDFQISKIYYANGGSHEYLTTWPAMCDDMLKESEFGKYINSSEKEGKKNILPTLNLGNKSALEQAQAITKYVKNNYNWNRYNSKRSEDNLSKFLKQKTGNSADINLFLTGLLRAAGIDANPIILSTRQHGRVNKGFPFQQFLNYVIVGVTINGESHYIDATEPMLSFDNLPERCINVEGLVVKPKSEEWVLLAQKQKATTEKQFYAKIDPSQNKATVDVSYTSHGFDAYDFRSVYLGKVENLEKYLHKNNNIVPKDGIKVRNFEDIEKPLEFSFSTDCAIEATPEKIFVNPFFNLAISENPFKQTSRVLPVDMIYIQGRKYNSTIEIPAGYKVEHLPRDITHNSQLMTINYKTSQVDKKIEIVADYAFKSNVYEAKDYLRLKATFSEIVKNFTDMIVLVKE